MTLTEAILARFCSDFEDFSFSTHGKSRLVKAAGIQFDISNYSNADGLVEAYLYIKQQKWLDKVTASIMKREAEQKEEMDKLKKELASIRANLGPG